MGSTVVGVSGGGMQDPSMRSLSRQGSLYSLTLDEVHNQIGSTGKPLGSMNLDELLNSLWSADANYQPSSAGEAIENLSGLCRPGNLLQKQPSFTLSRALSKKTVDEVWKDIQQGENKNAATMANGSREGERDRQPTLGEITLEDFLSMAGLMAEPSGKVGPESGVIPSAMTHQPENALHHSQWMRYQLPSVPQQQNVLPLFMSASHVARPPLSVVSAVAPILDAGFADAQIALSPSLLLGDVSDMQTPGHKRVAPEGIVEKTVERRQERMIKNRESAARSRARKQAYTRELENKVEFLEEEIVRLRKQRDLDKELPPTTEPKKKLRRTSSAPHLFDSMRQISVLQLSVVYFLLYM